MAARRFHPGGLFCAIGNPLNDGTWTYTWQNGRQLARMQSVDTDASFVYNENGLRVQKTVNGVVTKYTLHGKNVVHLSRENDELHFFYDAQNKPAVVVYNGVPYSYVKNLQGDIVAILDANGAVVVSYVYDAWGRPISCSGTMASTLGKINPFRYRGYVYDEETSVYYLRSRFYVPTYARFLNSDKYIPSSLLSKNLFAYCDNNVPIRLDPDGTVGVIGLFLAGITAAVVYDHKIMAAMAADAVLTDKGWYAANVLFGHSLWRGDKFTDKTDDVELLDSVEYVKSQIASAPQTLDMITPYVDEMLPGTSRTINWRGFEYTYGDMYYAFQHVNYEATITKNHDGSWSAEIHIKDKYNFDNLRNPFSSGGAANDFGWLMQRIGSMSEYDIDLTVTVMYAE